MLLQCLDKNSTKKFVHQRRMTNTAQKMKFSIKDPFSKCDQIHRKLQIWSHLLKKSLMENFIFCAVKFGMTNCDSKKISKLVSCFFSNQSYVDRDLQIFF